jgi:hypothetical protein
MKDFRNRAEAYYLTAYPTSPTNDNIDFMNSSFTAIFRSAKPEKNEKNLKIFDSNQHVNGLWLK